MSWRGSSWAKQTQGNGITRSEKFLLLLLGDYHNDEDDAAWPSVKRIAGEALMSERHARSLLHSLEAKGFLRIESQTGDHGSNRYVLDISGGATIAGGGGATIAGGRKQLVQGGAEVASSPKPPEEPPEKKEEKDRSWAEPFNDLFEETPEFIDQRKRSRMIELGELSRIPVDDLRARAIALVDWWPMNCGTKGKKRVAIVSTWSKFLSGDRPKAPEPPASKSTNGLAPSFDLSTEEGLKASSDYMRGRR